MADEKSKHVKVYTGSIVNVKHAQAELESQGISCIVKNDFESSLMAGFSSGTPEAIEIYVFDEDQEKALKIIDDLY